MELQQLTVDVSVDTEAFFTQLGKFALLIGTTPQFCKVQMDLGLAMVHGALRNKSYCLYVDRAGKPVAGLIWAYLNEDMKDHYLSHGVLPNLAAWRSGRQLWLLNVVARGGLLKPIFKDTMATLFKNEQEAFMLRPSPNGQRRVVRITRRGTEIVQTLPAPNTAPGEASEDR